MKVENKKGEFRPICITLESRDEVEALLSGLRDSQSRFHGSGLKRHMLEQIEAFQFKTA